jgi:hypothetical protein
VDVVLRSPKEVDVLARAAAIIERLSPKIKEALLRGATTPDGQEVVGREKDGVRVVILRKPTPFRGAMLATTIYRVKSAAKAQKR